MKAGISQNSDLIRGGFERVVSDLIVTTQVRRDQESESEWSTNRPPQLIDLFKQLA